MFTITNNNDSGSLKVGTVANRKWNIGDRIQILGEAKQREVTYIMGSGDKTHLCFKGQGRLPEGEVSFTVVGEE